MNPLKKITVLFVLLLTLFSFVKKEINSADIKSNLEEINVINILSKQKYECRPSSKYMFYVEANLVKKVRGANNINAKIFFLDKVSGIKNLLASENIQINKFKGAIAIQQNTSEKAFQTFVLKNGDIIIGDSENAPYSFKELISFESIYNSYVYATNNLLEMKRSI